MRTHWIKHWTASLSVRLWITAVATLALMLVLTTIIVTYVLNHYPEQTLGGREQFEKASELAKGLQFDTAGLPTAIRLSGNTPWLFEVLPTELKYRVLDAKGHVAMASSGARQDGPWGSADPASEADTIFRTQIGDAPFDIMTLAVPHGNAIYYVQTATSLRFVAAIIGEKIRPFSTFVRLTILIAMMTLASTLTGTVFVMLKPVREASRAALSITPRNVKARLSVEGLPSEVLPLIMAFNDALGRLENGFVVQQQFLASAAHELQTPLTLIRGQIELQDDIRDKDLLLREIDMMARQVRQLLHLAEVSESQNFTFGEVDPLEVARDVVDYLAPRADARGVTLLLDAHDDSTRLWADRSALFILLKNIVENAIHVTPPRCIVSIMVDAASIQIRDEGPGIAREAMPFLFKRFWRAPGAKHEGAGLGLAICKEIALAHEWRLTVSSLANGARFTVSF